MLTVERSNSNTLVLRILLDDKADGAITSPALLEDIFYRVLVFTAPRTLPDSVIRERLEQALKRFWEAESADPVG